MKEDYLFECLRKFDELPDNVQEVFGGYDACLKIRTIEEAYNINLSFAVILVAIGELTVDDLPEYLTLKFQIDRAKAEEITNHLDDQIFSAAVNLLVVDTPEVSTDQTAEPTFGPITEMSADDQKELILKTFEKQLLPALSAAPDKLRDFNIAIFQAFNADELLEDKVESLFYNNQEKIGDHQIILDGHPASPSVANWLKDFIKHYGSDIFNEVILAEYLSQSANVKQLKPDDKELVRKLLKLYYNMVFFPESMADVPLEEWQVFPIDKQYAVSEVPTASVKPENEAKVSQPVAAAPEANVSERQKIIFDLQKNLAKYSPSSLEYKAVREEIKRLTRQ